MEEIQTMGDNKKTKSSTASTKDSKQHQSDGNADLGATVSEASEQVQEQVMGLTEQIRQQADEQITTQKERLAETLETVALLLRQAGEHADLQDKAVLSGYVDKASGQVSQWSVALRERDTSRLLEDTVEYARRQPMVFLGGALAAGFAGARFLRSSAQKAQNWPQETTGNGSESTDVSGASEESAHPNPDMDLPTGIAVADIDVLAVSDEDLDYLEVVEYDTTAGLEGDPLIDGSLADDIDTTSMEQR
jgi:hypothetical protein